MPSEYIWWAQFLGALALPFALVIGIYQLASLAPGTIKVSQWEMVSSMLFLLAIIPVGILLVRAQLHRYISNRAGCRIRPDIDIFRLHHPGSQYLRRAPYTHWREAKAGYDSVVHLAASTSALKKGRHYELNISSFDARFLQ